MIIYLEKWENVMTSLTSEGAQTLKLIQLSQGVRNVNACLVNNFVILFNRTL